MTQAYDNNADYQEKEKGQVEDIKTLPLIKLKTLELIAQEIGNLDTGTNLINFLTDCGVDRKTIVCLQTKWRMVYDVLIKLEKSEKGENKNVLDKIICGAVHPAMHQGDTIKAEKLWSKFNALLKYDSLEIRFDGEKNTYEVYWLPTKKEREEIMAEGHAESEKEAKKQLEFLCRPENKEKISLLRKTYQALMGVVGVFCRNFPQLSHENIVELNKYYLMLDKGVWGIIDELQLGEIFDTYKYPRPFSNLFSAEKELNGEISWDAIRREMSARFGEIETLYQKVNASDILAKPDKQKWLDGITLYLSKLEKEAKGNERVKEIQAIKFEITKMPELTIKKNKQMKQYTPREDNLLLTKNLKVDISIGKLSACNDGTMRYGKKIIKMRNQIKDLCRFFMGCPNRLLTIDDIKDNIIRADKRLITPNITISKYVSELRKLLEIHFGKDVIFNQKEEGWYFKPPE